MRLSHRARLTLVSTLASGLILVVVFFGAFKLVEQSDRQSADRSIGLLSDMMVRDIDEGQKPDLKEVRESDPRASIAAFRGGALVQSVGGSVGSLHGAGIAELQGMTYAFREQFHRDWRLVVAIDYTATRASLNRLQRLLEILVLPIVGLVGAVSYLAAKKTFLPLAELTRQAAEFSGTELHRRLGLQDDAEFGALAGQLNALLDRIEEGAHRQERFVADAAHELRTPLAVLQGTMETALMKSRSAKEYSATLEECVLEVHRLARLTEALLQSARAPATAPPSLDLELVIDKIHARWLDRFIAMNVDLASESEPAVASIFEDEMVCVIDNLLENALRHSPPNSTCRLAVRRRENTVRIEVADEGPGIPEDQREAIFQRFVQVEGARSTRGFGIGLAVCRRIIEERGGTIRLAPSDKGALFVIELPASPL